MAAIGDLVRSLRVERGWSLRDLQSRLADVGINVSHTSIANKEKGGTSISPPERKAFAKAFGLSLEEFDAKWRGSRVSRTIGGQGIPVINRTPAGIVVDYEEYGVDSGQGFEYLERGSIDDELAFAVVVVGESMEPALFAGD